MADGVLRKDLSRNGNMRMRSMSVKKERRRCIVKRLRGRPSKENRKMSGEHGTPFF